MNCRLKFTNRYNERFYFVAFGDPWPHRPDLRLIGSTTPDPGNARVFDSAAEANETLTRCGDPEGWELEISPQP